MPAPEISAFGDGAHDAGTAGIDIDGGGFGAFPGSAWIYASSDRTGNSDQLTVNSWNDIQINVDIPASLNNSDGTRYLFVQREDLAWSQGFEFALGDIVPTISSATVSDIQATTVDLSFTTDDANGTAYYVVTESATQPSIAQIKAGQDHTGSAAVADGSVSVSSTSVSFNDVGPLTEDTTYYAHFVQTDAGANDSNRLSTESFVPTSFVLSFKDSALSFNSASLRHKSTALRHNDTTLAHQS